MLVKNFTRIYDKFNKNLVDRPGRERYNGRVEKSIKKKAGEQNGQL